MAHDTITTPYTTERMRSSLYGNPRYRLVTPDGLVIGTTRPDSSLAYGPVPNNADRGPCLITIHTTPSGRRYVDAVEPIAAK